MNPELRLLHLSFLFFMLNAQNTYHQCTAADKKAQKTSLCTFPPSFHFSQRNLQQAHNLYPIGASLGHRVTVLEGTEGIGSNLHQSSVNSYNCLSRLYLKASSKKQSIALFSGGFTTIIFAKFFQILSKLSPSQFKPIFVLPIFISSPL